MATKFQYSVYDKQHLRNLFGLSEVLKSLFLKATIAATKVGESTGFNDPEGEFSFSRYPGIKRRVDEIFDNLHKALTTTILVGNEREWMLSAKKNDALVDSLLGDVASKKAIVERWKNPNLKALAAFNDRKVRGMGLSQRVWNLTDQFKGELELALEVGLGEGKSAAELSRDVRQYLNEPHKLFRRIRNEKGQLRLSKAAAAYHPGQGVYRSSYKNALRLTATENNMAYRTADHERWKDLDFVVGIEIRLSGNHTCLGSDGKPHRFTDICDELAGRYPKSFKFTGWHPNCRCYAISILKTEEERDEDARRILRGEEPSTESVNTVKEMPENFNEWVRNNADRIENAANEPYFIRDNRAAVDAIINPPKVPTPQKIADQRHAARTPVQGWHGNNVSNRTKEEIRDIQQRWNERKLSRSALSGDTPALIVDPDRRANASISKQEKLKFEKEYRMASSYVAFGHKVELLREVPGISSPDAIIDGIKVDFKSLASGNNIMRHAKDAVFKQGADEVWFEFLARNEDIIQELNNLAKRGIHGKYYFKDGNREYSF